MTYWAATPLGLVSLARSSRGAAPHQRDALVVRGDDAPSAQRLEPRYQAWVPLPRGHEDVVRACEGRPARLPPADVGEPALKLAFRVLLEPRVEGDVTFCLRIEPEQCRGRLVVCEDRRSGVARGVGSRRRHRVVGSESLETGSARPAEHSKGNDSESADGKHAHSTKAS